MEKNVMLELRNVSSVHANGSPGVRNLSFTVEEGASVAVLGANGAGKTSLFLTLAGILAIQSGAVKAGGLELNSKNPGAARAAMGLVFQNPDDQLFMPTVWDDVLFGPRNLSLPEEECAGRALASLRETGIEELKDRSPLHLSGGEKRMAAIAGVLAMRPKILLLDEPTAFLDPKAIRSLGLVLKALGQTKLIATHNLGFAREVCSRVLILKKGALLTEGGISLLDDRDVIEEAFF
jgi:cobalt/nickel transport system ATP-binding protein